MFGSIPPSFRFDSVCLLPDEQIDVHTQDSWELSYVITGSGVRLIGDRTEPFSSGEVVLVPPGIPHCWHFDHRTLDEQGRIANITICFRTNLLERIARTFPELGEVIERLLRCTDAVKFGIETTNRIIQCLRAMEGCEAPARVAPFLALLPLMADAAEGLVVGHHQTMSREQERLNRIRTYVICNASRPITLDDVARHVGMNRAAFCTFFRRTMGKTFVTYLNEYRVEQACNLLEQGGISVAEACYRSGFNNVPYFNRVFKRVKGRTPTAREIES